MYNFQVAENDQICISKINNVQVLNRERRFEQVLILFQMFQMSV